MRGEINLERRQLDEEEKVTYERAIKTWEEDNQSIKHDIGACKLQLGIDTDHPGSIELEARVTRKKVTKILKEKEASLAENNSLISTYKEHLSLGVPQKQKEVKQ